MKEVIVKTDVRNDIREDYFDETDRCYKCMEYVKEVIEKPVYTTLNDDRYTYIKLIITNVKCKCVKTKSML